VVYSDLLFLSMHIQNRRQRWQSFEEMSHFTVLGGLILMFQLLI